MKKILFVTMNGEATDQTTWSGTMYNMYCELKKYFEVDLLNIEINLFWIRIPFILDHIIHKKNDKPEHTLKAGKIASGRLKKYLIESPKKYEIIFLTIGALAYEKLDVPIVYLSDSVFSQMVDYYWFNLSKRSINEGNALQKRALENADKIILTSEWAKKASTKDYQIKEEKIEIIHFGSSVTVRERGNLEHDNINILFIGVEYHRKGGKIAIECVRQLNQMDKEHRYILHFVGCEIPKVDKLPAECDFIKTYGFLNKNIPRDREQIQHLYEMADFFLLPTRAECSAIVYCEASAYSLPIITYDTGGTGDYVINGKNGYRLPLTATADEFAKKIKSIVQSAGELNVLKREAYNIYKSDLNWEVFGHKLQRVIDAISF